MLLKEISEKTNMPFADILWKYLGEDMLYRIYNADLKEYMWLGQKELTEEKLRLVYIENRKSLEEATTLILNQKTDITWSGVLEVKEQGYIWKLSAQYEDIKVDYPITIMKLNEKELQVPVTKDLVPMNPKYRRINYMVFSEDKVLAENMLEIILKLELIHDMNPYIIANQILKSQSISGRLVMEEFERFSKENNKILKEKRIDQLKGYREYGYMRKRWNQAAKKQNDETSWEEALDIIVAFLEPIWKALCNNEIFFDDWMPELGRYLG